MFQNHLKIAFRQLARHRVFSFINILGLSLGMAVVILIGVFARHEYNYDAWLPDSELTYRVYRDWGPESKTVWTPSRLAEKLMRDYPEVATASGFSPAGEQLVEYAGNQWYIEQTAQVDSTFFEVLEFPFLYGNANSALNEPTSMVISLDLAKKIFKDKNPVGETIRFNADADFMITGVIDLKTQNTHVAADIFTRFEWYSDYFTGNNRATYVQLKPSANIPNLEAKVTEDITAIMRQEYLSMNYTPTAEDFADWKLQALSTVHLKSDQYYFMSSGGGSERQVFIFILIGLLVLSVAIINYVNLATARARQRAKEVGVKKVTGAGRFELTKQFLTESIVQATLAAVLGMLLAEMLLPFFNHITNRELVIFELQPFLIIGAVISLAVITGVLAGIYPAFIMAAYRPVKALRANFISTVTGSVFRKVLVTSQFSITICLVIIMAFIYRQVNFMSEYELGFHPEQVMIIPFNSDAAHYKLENLKTQFEQIQGVETVTTASRFPGGFMPDWGMIIEGRSDGVGPNVIFSDADYAKALDIEMVEGRFLSETIAADSVNNFIVNERFVQEYQIENPIGTKVKWTADSTFGQIVGVMKDFHFQGLTSDINPLVMNAGHNRYRAGFKVSTQNLQGTIQSIQELWPMIEPDHPMRYTFLDDDFQQQYAGQERFGETMLYATFLTLFIALLGLFGLTLFNVERRTREIGIRKVLGASVIGVVGLLSKDFLKIAILSFFIAAPIGYYVSNAWLEDFPYRTNLVWWIFAGAGLITILVGFITVSVQSTRAALVNPVDSLRSE